MISPRINKRIKFIVIFFLVDLFEDLNASMVRHDVFEFFKIVISVIHFLGIYNWVDDHTIL